MYSIWFTFCLVPLLELPFEKALKNFSVVCIPAAPDSASQPEILLQAFPKLISPILLLLFPCRAASFSPQVPFCLLFIRHLFLKQQQSFLPVRRMNFSLFSLKKIRKKQKLSLTICSCIITRIRMFCLTRPRISITNYSVLWIMLRVS